MKHAKKEKKRKKEKKKHTEITADKKITKHLYSMCD